MEKKFLIFLLRKFYQRWFFNEVEGNTKQTILFWPMGSKFFTGQKHHPKTC